MSVLFVLMLVLGAAAVVVGLERGDDRREIVVLGLSIVASLLVFLPDVVPGSKDVVRFTAVVLLVGVAAMIILRRRRR
jgi:hypothetical protein